jgi:hypothetical protein
MPPPFVVPPAIVPSVTDNCSGHSAGTFSFSSEAAAAYAARPAAAPIADAVSKSSINRTIGNSSNHPNERTEVLNLKAASLRDKAMKDSTLYIVENETENNYRVYHQSKERTDANIVYYDEVKECCNCLCLKSWNDGIACRHIFAVIHAKKQLNFIHDEQKQKMFFHRCYFLDNLRYAYSKKVILPLNAVGTLDNTIGPIITGGSWTGRRITSNFNQHQEVKSGVPPPKCSLCKMTGHNKQTCAMKNFSAEQMNNTIQDLQNPTAVWRFISVDLKPFSNPDVSGDNFLGSADKDTSEAEDNGSGDDDAIESDSGNDSDSDVEIATEQNDSGKAEDEQVVADPTTQEDDEEDPVEKERYKFFSINLSSWIAFAKEKFN